jgi:hypothetical protein
MLANTRASYHSHELVEQGFAASVVKEAAARQRHSGWADGGYEAAMINYQFMAHAIFSTDGLVKVTC